MVPYYPNQGSKDYQWMDIYNALGRQRTLFVTRFLDDEACNQLIASLIYLQGQNENQPITLYMNVPGSFIKPSFAVFDVMRRMKCPIVTINMGLTVGMGALLCALGSKGQRYAFPNARFLMAKTGLEDGLEGQAIELGLAVNEVLKDNQKYVEQLARLTGNSVPKISDDLKRDFYLTAGEAAGYGVIDTVLTPLSPVKMAKYRGNDDRVIGYGHFAESRRVMTGPDDQLLLKNGDNEVDLDQTLAESMMDNNPNLVDRKTGRINPAELRNGGGKNRFANSRIRPPGLVKKKKPASDGDDVDGTGGNDKFANSGWG